MTRRRRAGLVAVAVALAGAGCGLPEDERPRIISAEDAPLVLGGDPAAQPDQPGPGTSVVDLFFLEVDGQRLRSIGRVVSSDDLRGVITALLEGVAADDPTTVTTAIPADTVLNAVEVVDGVAVIDLGPTGVGIFAIGGPEQKAAFAQLVFTAMEVRGVTGVQFRVDGQPLDAPTDAGASRGPLTTANFATLDPRQS